MDPELIKKALGLLETGDSEGALALLKDLIASAAGGEPADPAGADEALAEDPAADPAADPASAPAAMAALTMLTTLTGTKEPGEAVAWLKRLSDRVNALDSDRASLELSSRRELIGELVTLGVEFPSTAWEGKPEDRKPVKRLAEESLDSLRTRVGLLRKARPARPAPPEHTAPDVSKLSQEEIEAGRKRGWTPEQVATRKQNAIRRAPRVS